MILHAKHASNDFKVVICVADDTDVLIRCFAFAYTINCQILVRRGQKNRLRLVDVSKLSKVLGSKLCTALLGVHTFSGCDTVSALSGQGKLKAFKLLEGEPEYLDLFVRIGQEWDVSEELFQITEKFEVNELRYKLFSIKQGKADSACLPPCADCLRQHILRANFQTAIWRRSLDQRPYTLNPTDGHGWKVDTGNIALLWMTGRPAPQSVLQ